MSVGRQRHLSGQNTSSLLEQPSTKKGDSKKGLARQLLLVARWSDRRAPFRGLFCGSERPVGFTLFVSETDRSFLATELKIILLRLANSNSGTLLAVPFEDQSLISSTYRVSQKSSGQTVPACRSQIT
ncbi:hypothetical protein L596_030375 [Steinernema carpocapsae]|uniref:Uncharacterized protein n=1 Tax=Steinernema carpocapsae TaxID=34508 RepID=A0A4U5LP93_STECR|nr:hypothetical protein L596_030375 [Steinernema carpocapsae]